MTDPSYPYLELIGKKPDLCRKLHAEIRAKGKIADADSERMAAADLKRRRKAGLLAVAAVGMAFGG